MGHAGLEGRCSLPGRDPAGAMSRFRHCETGGGNIPVRFRVPEPRSECCGVARGFPEGEAGRAERRRGIGRRGGRCRCARLGIVERGRARRCHRSRDRKRAGRFRPRRSGNTGAHLRALESPARIPEPADEFRAPPPPSRSCRCHLGPPHSRNRQRDAGFRLTPPRNLQAGLLFRDVEVGSIMREAGGRRLLMDIRLARWCRKMVASVGSPAPCPCGPGGPARRLPEAPLCLADYRPDLAAGFVTIVEKTMDPDPRRRLMTAGAMFHALDGFAPPAEEERSMTGAPARRVRYAR